jgi:hypothetical protein
MHDSRRPAALEPNSVAKNSCVHAIPLLYCWCGVDFGIREVLVVIWCTTQTVTTDAALGNEVAPCRASTVTTSRA